MLFGSTSHLELGRRENRTRNNEGHASYWLHIDLDELYQLRSSSSNSARQAHDQLLDAYQAAVSDLAGVEIIDPLGMAVRRLPIEAASTDHMRRYRPNNP